MRLFRRDKAPSHAREHVLHGGRLRLWLRIAGKEERLYARLRIAGYRVIFKERAERGGRVIECIYAERRALVYEIFVRLLTEQAME